MLVTSRGRCNLCGLWLSYLFVLVLVFGIQGCWSLNSEGVALLEFRARVSYDPYGSLRSWNPEDSSPCRWSGIHCIDDRVRVLDLNGLSLEGMLAPKLGELRQLRSLVLRKNHFSGAVPKELGGLAKLELMDLRDNNFSGPIPTELRGMSSLKCLLLRHNNFEGSIPAEVSKLKLLSELEFDENLTYATGLGMLCINRKLQNCIWQNSLKKLYKTNSVIIPIKDALIRYFNALQLSGFRTGKISQHGQGNYQHNLPGSSEPKVFQNVQNLLFFSRRKLLEQSANIPAAPFGSQPMSAEIISLPSGSFPAVPDKKGGEHATPRPKLTHGRPVDQLHSHGSSSDWKFIWIVPVAGVTFIIAAASCFLVRHKGIKAIGPWKTGLSGQLQKALVTGVPKLNRSELETACEDFSNIIETLDGCTVYKGTLSSGVEIAVASLAVNTSKDWSDSAEIAYRKKIDMLSRLNHKNFVNLIGHCEEDEPFSRMMVFEYAPSGSLFDHLHVEEMEHLDWSTRMRIIMGTVYCLQHMHHELDPPVAHSNLNSSAIYLTDDYAAKIAEVNFVSHSSDKIKNITGESTEVQANIYNFGVLLLEIISGKLPYSEEQGHIVNWAAEFLNNKRNTGCIIDPTLQSFKNGELEVICEVVQECILPNPRQRPSMKDIASKLRQGIGIAPDQAIPSLSPLWWAELEILSQEAN